MRIKIKISRTLFSLVKCYTGTLISFSLDDYTNKEVYDCSQYKSSYFHLENGCNEHLKKRFNSYSIPIKHFSFFFSFFF